MADLKYKVQVDTKDAQKSIGGLTKALGALAAAVSIRELVGFADSVTTIQNKLKSFISDANQAGIAFDTIGKISLVTGQNIETVGDIFTKVGRTADGLGLSLQDTANFTLQLSSALSVFGASSREAESALYNIGQAFSLGRFQGEDLNAVIENLGPVAQKMAEIVGVQSVGALKQLASEGKVSARVIVDALKEMDKQGLINLSRRIPTVSQALNQLRTAALLAVGAVDEQGKVTTTVSRAVTYFAFQIYKATKNIKEILGPLQTLFKIGMALLSFTIIGKVVKGVASAFAGLRAATADAFIELNKLGKTFAVLWHYLKRLAGQAEGTKPIWEGLAKSAGYLGRSLAELAGWIGGVVAAAAAFVGIDDLFSDFNELSDDTSQLTQELAEFEAQLITIDSALSDVAGSGVAVAESEQEIANQLAQVNQEIQNGIRAYQERQREQLRSLEIEKQLIGAGEEAAKKTTELQAFEERYLQEKQRLQEEIAKAQISNDQNVRNSIGTLNEALNSLIANYGREKQAIEEGTQAVIERTRENNLLQFSIQQQIEMQQKLRELQDEYAATTMTTLEKGYQQIEIAAREAAQAAIEAEEARRGEKLDPAEIQRYYDEAKKGSEALKEQFKENYEASREFETGWTNAINAYVEQATDGAARAKQVFDTMTKGFEDAIVNFVKTGKLSFKDLINSMIELLVRSQLQKLMASIFGSMGGGAGGIGKIFGFADGGRPPINKPSVVGEKGPELFVPNTAGRVIPNDQLGGGTVNNTYITNQISALDAKSVAQLFAENRKTLLGTVQMAQKEMPYGM